MREDWKNSPHFSGCTKCSSLDEIIHWGTQSSSFIQQFPGKESRRVTIGIFRGTSSSKFAIQPTGGVFYSQVQRNKAIELFRSRVNLDQLIYPPETDLDWLALGQHYGLPTNLTDWTSNVRIAAYFATLPNHETKSEDAVIHYIEDRWVATPLFRNENILQQGNMLDWSGGTVRLFKAESTKRMKAQEGHLLYHLNAEEPWIPDVPHIQPIKKIHRFVCINAESKETVYRELLDTGVNEISLFPDRSELLEIDRIAETIKLEVQ